MQAQNFKKRRPLEPKLFHADGRTDGQDETNSFFFAILREPVLTKHSTDKL